MVLPRIPQVSFIHAIAFCDGIGFVWRLLLLQVQEDAKKVYLPLETEAVYGKPFSVEKLLRFREHISLSPFYLTYIKSLQ